MAERRWPSDKEGERSCYKGLHRGPLGEKLIMLDSALLAGAVFMASQGDAFVYCLSFCALEKLG